MTLMTDNEYVGIVSGIEIDYPEHGRLSAANSPLGGLPSTGGEPCGCNLNGVSLLAPMWCINDEHAEMGRVDIQLPGEIVDEPDWIAYEATTR